MFISAGGAQAASRCCRIIEAFRLAWCDRCPNGMADIGHGGHSSVNDLYHDALASVQIALSFIDVKLDETDWIDIEEKGTADNGAGSWEDERVP